MIVVAGLTPAYQQIMVHDTLRPGEVNRARDVRWCASGKVLNVAVALARFGGPLLTNDRARIRGARRRGPLGVRQRANAGLHDADRN
jgi:hypothetical protein